MTKKKITTEIATEDIERWLDSKRISSRKRDANEEAQAVLVGAIEDGVIIVNDDNTLTQKLIFPTGEDGKGVNEITYKNRMTVGDRNIAVKGVKANDGDGRLQGYVAQLTDQPIGVIKKLDSGEDFEIAQSIAVYFL